MFCDYFSKGFVLLTINLLKLVPAKISSLKVMHDSRHESKQKLSMQNAFLVIQLASYIHIPAILVDLSDLSLNQVKHDGVCAARRIGPGPRMSCEC